MKKNILMLIVSLGIGNGSCATEPQTESTPLQTNQPLTTVLFSHGFGGSRTGRLVYIKGYERVVSYLCGTHFDPNQTKNYLYDRATHRITSFNYDDVFIDLGIYGSIPNPTITHLGQLNDINKLHSHIEKLPVNDFIGFGVSRGAATWITTLGTRKISKKLRALVVESPFATMKEVSMYNLIKYYLEYAHLVFDGINVDQVADIIFKSIFQSHQIDGIQPINVASGIDKSIPIMLVHSEEDAIIPLNASRELYIALKQAGHEHVYLLELQKGAHAALLWGPQGELYRNVIHAFYKHYNLVHDAEFAKDIDLKVYQPSISIVTTRIAKDKARANNAKEKARFSKPVEQTTTWNICI